MKRFGLVALAVMALAVATRPAMAQGSVRYGFAAGVLMPMGDYGDADKMGFIGGAGATYWLAGNAVGIRGEVNYAQTSHDGIGGKTKIAGGMASVVYGLNPASAPARILLTGGVGLYNVKLDVTGFGSASETKVGFGAGAAVAFKLGTGSTRLVVASRFQSIATSGSSLTMLPLTVGLSFGK